jgi:hypothetical protein
MPLVSVGWHGRPASEYTQCVPLLFVSCIPYLGSVLHAHKLLHQFLTVRQFSRSYRLNQSPSSSPPQRIRVCQRLETVPCV